MIMLKKISYILTVSSFLLITSITFSSTIKVGVVTNFDYKLVNFLQEQDDELNIKIIKFDDIDELNHALVEKKIDINLFQPQNYLETYNKEHGNHLKIVSKEYIEPMGIYSELHSTIKGIQVGASIVVPEEPSNNSRALKLLDEAGILKVITKDVVSKDDIIENYFDVEIVEESSDILPRFLQYADFVVLSGEQAFEIGYTPKNDSLFLETINPEYVSVVAVRKEDVKKENITAFVKKIKSKEVELFILKNYKDNIHFLE